MDVTEELLKATMKETAEELMKGIHEYTGTPIVPVDVIHNPASSILVLTTAW